MIPADPTDSFQVNNIPSWWFEDAQRVPTDDEDEDSVQSEDPGLDIPFFLRAASPVVPNPDLSYEVQSPPPPPPPVNENPPFPPPYEGCIFYQFRDIEDARNYCRHLNNHEACWVAIPSTFLHRIVENPSNPVFGYILRK